MKSVMDNYTKELQNNSMESIESEDLFYQDSSQSEISCDAPIERDNIKSAYATNDFLDKYDREDARFE